MRGKGALFFELLLGRPQSGPERFRIRIPVASVSLMCLRYNEKCGEQAVRT